jgi:hypothetical protein
MTALPAIATRSKLESFFGGEEGNDNGMAFEGGIGAYLYRFSGDRIRSNLGSTGFVQKIIYTHRESMGLCLGKIEKEKETRVGTRGDREAPPGHTRASAGPTRCLPWVAELVKLLDSSYFLLVAMRDNFS